MEMEEKSSSKKGHTRSKSTSVDPSASGSASSPPATSTGSSLRTSLRSSGSGVDKSPATSPGSSRVRRSGEFMKGHRRNKSLNDPLPKKSVLVTFEEKEKKQSTGSLWKSLTFWKPESTRENIRFYSGDRPSKPEGDMIDNIHRLWFSKYDLLEEHHGYFQWIFPNFESSGINTRAYTLRKEEATWISKDLICSFRIVHSYRMMLNFYGLQLLDMKTGAVGHNDIWECRYANLNISPHNYSRITRMLKALGCLGFQRFVRPFIEFMSQEINEHKLLPNCKKSLQNYWLPLVDPSQDVEESAYFQHADQNTPQFQAFLDEIKKGKFWETSRDRTRSDEVLIEEFRRQLEEADQIQKQNLEKAKADGTGGELRDRDMSYGSLTFFKVHYNNQEEKEQAVSDFMASIEAGKEKVNQDRAKALAALQQMVADKKKGNPDLTDAQSDSRELGLRITT